LTSLKDKDIDYDDEYHNLAIPCEYRDYEQLKKQILDNQEKANFLDKMMKDAKASKDFTEFLGTQKKLEQENKILIEMIAHIPDLETKIAELKEELAVACEKLEQENKHLKEHNEKLGIDLMHFRVYTGEVLSAENAKTRFDKNKEKLQKITLKVKSRTQNGKKSCDLFELKEILEKP